MCVHLYLPFLSFFREGEFFRPFYGNADLIHEAPLMEPLSDPLNSLPLVGGLLMWYPSLPVLKRKLAGAAAIPQRGAFR